MEEDKIGEDNEIFKVSKTSFMNEGVDMWVTLNNQNFKYEKKVVQPMMSKVKDRS